MSENPSENIRALAEVVTPVDEKITLGKDRTKPYVGLENIPSRAAYLAGWQPASSSISTNSIFQVDDVLFGKLRPNLRKCVVAPFDGYCSTDILVLRANEGVDPSFAGKVLRAERVASEAERTSMGTKMPRTSWGQLRTLKVFCPHVREQALIASVLDTLDTTIRQTEAIIAKLKQVKQGLLHDLLTRGIDANGELRPQQSQAPNLYKQSPLGWIPKEWDVEMLEALTEPDSPITYGVVKPGLEVDGGVPFIRGGDIFNGHVLIEQLRTIGVDVSHQYRRTLLRGGELLMSLVGYPGEVAVVPRSLRGANIARQAALIRLTAATNANYIMHYLSSPSGKRQVLASSLGSAQQVVNLSDLRSVRVPLADIDEQAKICLRLAAANGQIESANADQRKLMQLKSGLMDDLLTGRVRVTPLLETATA